jgi:hypothetical protein
VIVQSTKEYSKAKATVDAITALKKIKLSFKGAYI